jgi:hypothetical protein
VEAAGTSQMLEPVYQTTRHQIPGYCNINTHGSWYLKSQMLAVVFQLFSPMSTVQEGEQTWFDVKVKTRQTGWGTPYWLEYTSRIISQMLH